MDDAKATARDTSRGAGIVVVLTLILVLLPIVYCAGVGPAIWLVNEADVDPTVFQVIYGPLEWVHDNVDILRPPLDWYVSLWK